MWQRRRILLARAAFSAAASSTSSTFTENRSSTSSSSSSSSPRSPPPPPNAEPSQVTVTSSNALFQPITIGKRIHLPNRFMMQPMYLNVESELGMYTTAHMDAMASFFGERAHYGAKLIVLGGLAPSRMGRWRAGSMLLTTTDAAKALRKVTRAVHSEDGFILAQAFNAGRAARKRFLFSSTSVPSPVHPVPYSRPTRLPGFMVGYVVSEYQRFARLAEDAGFDGIEIPVSEGTLLHNFLSTAVNTREDDFGGSLDRRLEIIIRVLESVKEYVKAPDDFAVSLRLCLHDLKPGGTPMAETLRVAEVLAKSGYIDLLNTSVAMHDSPVQTLASYVPQGTFARCCQLVKERFANEKIAIPVVASHRIHSMAVAERLMERGVCDLVGIGRPLLADAQFIVKGEKNRTEETLPCIGCNHCINRVYKHQRVTCALNPIAGYELERSWSPAKHKKTVAVVGAGPAGVTCAMTLWRRGHDVTLFERASYVGGQLNLAKVIPGKESYQDVLEYWTRQLRHSSINVRLETEFTREEVARNHQFFHAVVLTTGSIPTAITSSVFPGASESPLVVPFRRILDGSVTAGRRVVIIGNGAIAHDVASFLLHDPRVSRSVDMYLDEWGVNLEEGTVLQQPAERVPRNNRDVIVFNKADRDADLSRGKGWTQKLWIRNHGGTILPFALVENIDKDGLHMSVAGPLGSQYFIPCDTIVWCKGMLANMTVGTWIHEWYMDGAGQRGEVLRDFGVYMAGSCRDSFSTDGRGEQDMLQAVHEGYEIGCKV